MSSLYESMTGALREHWKAHNNAYPQRFELTASAHAALVENRELVVTTMNYSNRSALGEDFLGVPIVVSDAGNVMVAADGARVSLSI
ncbi:MULTISPECIES: hypothetical protein [Comamonas]|uniref:hypothetical protein n=1 Tax=Comamonas TaxID=283 RepID=UPI00257A8BA5|nr:MULTISPECIES: hypothetical protein [Comamonas]